jgi:hypothetical protein
LGITLLDSITIGVKVLTRYLENGPVGQRFYLMGLAGYMPDDIAGTKTLFMMFANLRIDPSMYKIARRHVPSLVFEQVIVHAGLCALTKD